MLHEDRVSHIDRVGQLWIYETYDGEKAVALIISSKLNISKEFRCDMTTHHVISNDEYLHNEWDEEHDYQWESCDTMERIA
jgi:hypothetical protein